MTSHQIHAALARERHSTFLAEAQAARLARQVGDTRAAGWGTGGPQAPTPPLAAARLEATARPAAGARAAGKAGRAARRVNGADPAGPQH